MSANTTEIPLREYQPDGDDCTARRRVRVAFDGQTVEGWACWYPQMGGYVSVALVMPGGDGGCFDVLVWHDGAFPFSGDGGDCRSPARLHHCSAEQFVDFGRFVAGLPDA